MSACGSETSRQYSNTNTDCFCRLYPQTVQAWREQGSAPNQAVAGFFSEMEALISVARLQRHHVLLCALVCSGDGGSVSTMHHVTGSYTARLRALLCQFRTYQLPGWKNFSELCILRIASIHAGFPRTVLRAKNKFWGQRGIKGREWAFAEPAVGQIQATAFCRLYLNQRMPTTETDPMTSDLQTEERRQREVEGDG